jgi:acyl carrier protein
MSSNPASTATLVEQILCVFAKEARVERTRLRLDARADELGITSLDLALAMFELESRFGIELPEPPPGALPPTVGEMVEQVLACLPPQAHAQAQAQAA